MSAMSRLRRLFGRENEKPANALYGEQMDKAAQRLATMRGDRVTALPADAEPTTSENVAAAAKDYGLSRFSGESDALGSAAGGYRSSRSKKSRTKQT